jgi:hypothetical protein
MSNSKPSSFKVVYKKVHGQEIDADVYLPRGIDGEFSQRSIKHPVGKPSM